jgi:hypothetical protein
MKPQNKQRSTVLAIVLLLANFHAFAQAVDKNSVSLGVNYFAANNTIPYVLVRAKSKIDGKFKPVANIAVAVYLDTTSAATLIGKVLTNNKGEAVTLIPPSLKAKWQQSKKHSFYAVFDGNKQYDANSGDVSVGKAKIVIDTSADRKITATVLALKDSTWQPVAGAELKIGIRRLDGDLSINETATFTTDSTGQTTADFKRDSIPGDTKGNIVLVAKMEDNEQYGNISTEKIVPWGGKFVTINDTFDRRTLFGTRDKTPIWLLLIASSIIVAVWGIIIKLVFSLITIKKLGHAAVGV